MGGQKEGLNEGNRGILCREKEAGESIMGYREKLRKKLKHWERKFKEQEGRSPEKADIRKDKKMSIKRKKRVEMTDRDVQRSIISCIVEFARGKSSYWARK